MISELLLPNVKLSNAKANTLIINKVFDSLFSQEKRKETINAKARKTNKSNNKYTKAQWQLLATRMYKEV